MIPPLGGPRGLPGVDDALIEAVSVLVSVVAPSDAGGVIEFEVVAGAGSLPDGEVPVEVVVPIAAARSFEEPDTAVGPALLVIGAMVAVVVVGAAGAVRARFSPLESDEGATTLVLTVVTGATTVVVVVTTVVVVVTGVETLVVLGAVAEVDGEIVDDVVGELTVWVDAVPELIGAVEVVVVEGAPVESVGAEVGPVWPVWPVAAGCVSVEVDVVVDVDVEV